MRTLSSLLLLPLVAVAYSDQRTQTKTSSVKFANAKGMSAERTGKRFGECTVDYSSGQQLDYGKLDTAGVEIFQCPTKSIVTVNYGSDKATKTCCPASSDQCAGCESRPSGERCQKCQAGFAFTQSKAGGTHCELCDDESFLDDEGNTCRDYTVQKWCQFGKVLNKAIAEKKNNRTSAAEACCSCGGGKRMGGPFNYRELLQGQTVHVGRPFKFHPYPRTANEYYTDDKCAFSQHGIELDPKTGAIYALPAFKNVKEPVNIKCEITAVQDSGATFTVPVTVPVETVSLFPPAANRGSNILLLSDETKTSKFKITSFIGKLADLKIACTPGPLLDITPTGEVSLQKRWVDDYDSLFTNFGNIALKSSSFSLSPRTAAADVRKVDAVCTVSGYGPNSKLSQTHFFAIALPKKVETLAYDKSEISLFAGRPLLPPIQPIKKTLETLPMRIGCSWSSGSRTGETRFSQSSGYVKIQDQRLFHFNTSTGVIGGTPAVDLLNHLGIWQESELSLTCQIYMKSLHVVSFYEDSDSVVVSKAAKLSFTVRDTSCWLSTDVYAAQNVGDHTWVPIKGQVFEPSASADCKLLCRLNNSCTGFVKDGDGCSELVFSTNPNKVAAAKGTVRVPDCQKYKTCMQLTADNNYYASGVYCPIVPEATGRIVPLYKKQSPIAEEVMYLRPYTDAIGKKHGVDAICKGTSYIVQHAIVPEGTCRDTHWKDTAGNTCANYVEKGWCKNGHLLKKDKEASINHCCACGRIPFHLTDVTDTDTGYTELHGDFVTCLKVTGETGVTHHHRHVKAVAIFAGEEEGAQPTQGKASIRPTTKECNPPGGNVGHVLNGGNEVTKQIFEFGDPASALKKDYALDACDCFGKSWSTSPVSDDSYAVARNGGKGMFNKLRPNNVKLFSGGFTCAVSNNVARDLVYQNASKIQEGTSGTQYSRVYFLSSADDNFLKVLTADNVNAMAGGLEIKAGEFIKNVNAQVELNTKKISYLTGTTNTGRMLPFDSTLGASTASNWNGQSSFLSKTNTWHPYAGFWDQTPTTFELMKGSGGLPLVQLRDHGSYLYDFQVPYKAYSSSFQARMLTTNLLKNSELTIRMGDVQKSGKTAETKCLDDELVVGGWCQYAGVKDGYRDYYAVTENWANTDKQFRCWLSYDNYASYNKYIYFQSVAVCSKSKKVTDPGNYKRVQSSLAYGTNSVQCPSGFTAVSGGCYSQTDAALTSQNSEYASNGWKCSMTGAQTRAHAICIKNSKMITLEASDGKQITNIKWNGNQLAIVEEGTPPLQKPPQGTMLMKSLQITPESVKSCAMECHDLPECRAYVTIEAAKAQECQLFRECRQVAALGYSATATAYALVRDNDKPICRVADPEKCWAQTKRRAMLSGYDPHSTKKYRWSNIAQQCDMLKMMGSGITDCIRASYYNYEDMEFEMLRVPVPKKFPHGSQVKLHCADNYRILHRTGSDRPATVTCMDGAWKTPSGKGLSAYSCAGCIETAVQDDISELSPVIASGESERFFFGKLASVVSPFPTGPISPPLAPTLDYSDFKLCIDSDKGSCYDYSTEGLANTLPYKDKSGTQITPSFLIRGAFKNLAGSLRTSAHLKRTASFDTPTNANRIRCQQAYLTALSNKAVRPSSIQAEEACLALSNFHWTTIVSVEGSTVFGDTTLDCPAGTALFTVSIKKSTVSETGWIMGGECHYAPGTGLTTVHQTEIKSVQDVLGSKAASCPAGKVITKLIFKKGELSLYCSGLAANVVVGFQRDANSLIAPLIHGGNKDSGVFCPAKMDQTGRLEFEQVYSYETKHTLSKDSESFEYVAKPKVGSLSSNTMAYNANTGKWCVGSACSTSRGLDHPDKITSGEPLLANPVLDMVWEGLGTSGDQKKDPNALPPYPALMTFKAATPAYNPNCMKDGHRTTPEEMTEAKEGDPCYPVATGNGLAGWTESNKASDVLPGLFQETIDPKLAKSPGIDYKVAWDCLSRDGARNQDMASQDRDTWIQETKFELGASAVSAACSLLPDFQVGFAWGAEAGATVKPGEICEEAQDVAVDLNEWVNERKAEEYEVQNEIAGNADCDPYMIAMARMSCDINCVMDAVVQGDKATTTNLQNMYDALNTNNEMLQAYWGTVLSTKIGALSKQHHHREGVNGALDELKYIVNDYIKSDAVESLMESATDEETKVHLDGANEFEHAHHTVHSAWDNLRNQIEQLDSDEPAKPEDIIDIIQSVSKKLSKTMSHSHHRLANAMARPSSTHVDAHYLRDHATTAMSSIMQPSLDLSSASAERQRTIISTQMKSAERLLDASSLLVGSKGHNSLSALNWKMDHLSAQINGLQATEEMRNLQYLTSRLNLIGSRVAERTNAYLSKVDELHQHHRSSLQLLDSYFNCGADDDSVDRAYRQAYFLKEDAKEELEVALSRAASEMYKMSEVVEQRLLPRIANVALKQAVAFTGGLKSEHHSLHAAHASIMLSEQGLMSVAKSIAEALDDMPLSVSKQLKAVSSHLVYLYSASSGNSSLARELKTTMKHMKSTHKQFAEALSHHNGLGRDLTIAALGEALPQLYPAPPTCADLAFQNYGESRTAELVTLGEVNPHSSHSSSLLEEDEAMLSNSNTSAIRKQHHKRGRNHHRSSTKTYLITVGPEQLLMMPAGSKISLSKAFDIHGSESMKVPISTVRNSYVCSKDAQNNWSLTSALELPESKRVVICNTDSCEDGISVARINENVMRHIKDSSLVKMWK